MDTQSLADRIARSDPAHRTGLERIHDHLVASEGHLPAEDADLRARWRAASLLMRSLVDAPDPAAPEDLCVVADLIHPSEDPRETWCGELPGKPLGDAEEPAREASAESLRLVSDLLLGDILLQMNAITPTELEDALRVQLRTRERIGACLVRARSVTQGQLDAALEFQLRFKHDADATEPAPDDATQPVGQRRRDFLHSVTDCLLGEMLVRLGRVTQAQLDQALVVQRATGMRIGEALVDTGATSWGHIERALEIQKQRRVS